MFANASLSALALSMRSFINGPLPARSKISSAARAPAI